ncbi:helix-turn-helix domain-containing protein [Emcibacter nanhaiensis]|uniref:Helix-turn-helix transcriptional regulator n=1 Tax=Emcibacter nanhaiensis TaxID=1505037 RepID=A0A501PEX3_9PROT|nr:helix-turn-helix transcriptional regulator [Emcibacter nanhaiensis]
MITSSQIRAARALIKWSAQKLADEAGIGISTVQRMEKAEGVPTGSIKNLDLIQKTLENAGVEFIPENGGGVGVRLQR